MFQQQISKFIDIPKNQEEWQLYGTKNSYEFDMAAFCIGYKWYVFVESPDTSRVEDIDEVIEEEYDARVIAWCVVKSSGAGLLEFEDGSENYEAITYREASSFYWLLQIRPQPGSRLPS